MTRNHRFLALAFVLLGLASPGCIPDEPDIVLPGLEKRVRVLTDGLGVPHLVAWNDRDLARVTGYVHARDRFFQMDVSRRQGGGTLAELTGSFNDLFGDAAARTAGFRGAAGRSWDAMSGSEREILEAYAAGVNAWLAANPLPPEYAQLGLTAAAPWSPIDSLLIVFALSAVLGDVGFDVEDTEFFQSWVTACAAADPPCDGRVLADDLYRHASFEPAATVPDATGELPFVECEGQVAATPRAATVAGTPRPGLPAERLESDLGSNIWAVSGEHSATGRPLLASDPHLPLGNPATFYEVHQVVKGESGDGPMNVAGMSIPGIPAVFLGKNLDIAWSSTNLFSDHSDAFRDRLVRDAAGCPTRLCIESAGELHRVEERAESYRVNTPSDGVPDNLTDFTALMRNVAPEAVNVLRVPFRSHGFVRAVTDRSVIDDPNATATETVVVTQQYSGLHGDPGLRGPWLFQRARDVHEFAEGVRALATFSANWVVIDRSGNLAYYTSGELPLRPDLESGDPTARPWEIRDGSGPHNWIPDPDRSQGQVLPFRVLPFEEMPHALNPPAGFLVNANNSPDGAGRDGNLLNQCRPSNPEALYYLGRWHDHGGRAGRITRLLREPLEAGEKLGIEDMKRIQGNTQHLVAERLVPFLAAAWGRAQESGAPPELAALGADPEVAEAVGRLQEWDLTAPTGIPEGYDAADVDGVLDPLVGPEEAEASVAATLFWHWRGALHRNTTRRSLAALGLDFFGGARGNSMVALLSAEPFTGVGEAGVDFFPGPVPLSPGERRDLALLQSVRDALDTLAAAPTFGRSTNQDDYRWGLQNRLVLHHLLGGVFSIPPAGGFQDLGPGLRGLARDGLGRTVNPSFVGSVRVILQAGLGPDHGFSSLAGGASGDPASPHHADRLGRWLTVDLDPMELAPARVAQAGAGEEVFGP